MLTKLVRYYSSFEQIQAANKEREAMIKEIYKPIRAEKELNKRLELMYSGKLWLNHAELEIRPKDINYEVRKQLDGLDDFIAERHTVEKRDYLEDEIGWLLFKVALTYHSTAIEGNSLSFEQTKAVFEDDTSNEISYLMKNESQFLKIHDERLPKDDIREVIEHEQAMEYIRNTILRKRKAITEDDIVSIHAIVCPSALLIRHNVEYVPEDTKYRRLCVKVKGSPAVCPYLHELPSLMKELLRIHDEKSKLLHPVISACQFHMNFLWIHPFIDGNGRTARLLTNILLFNSGYCGIVIPISEHGKYFSYFELERHHDNTDYFLYMISKIKETMIEFSFL